jgi:hypothetical protein
VDLHEHSKWLRLKAKSSSFFAEFRDTAAARTIANIAMRPPFETDRRDAAGADPKAFRMRLKTYPFETALCCS